MDRERKAATPGDEAKTLQRDSGRKESDIRDGKADGSATWRKESYLTNSTGDGKEGPSVISAFAIFIITTSPPSSPGAPARWFEPQEQFPKRWSRLPTGNPEPLQLSDHQSLNFFIYKEQKEQHLTQKAESQSSFT